MSVLVFAENWDGVFKKTTYELVSYASALAAMTGDETHVLSIGDVPDDQLNSLGLYGASVVWKVEGEAYRLLDNRVYTDVISQLMQKTGAHSLVLSHNNTGKALAPRLSVRMKASLGASVVALPESVNPFVVKKKVFNGNAFARVSLNTEVKIITLLQNVFGVADNARDVKLENFLPEHGGEFVSARLIERKRESGKVLLTDAGIVVSGGRGMKGPENWGLIEELAGVLNAATACSRPVSDEGWRPHEEHTGQTGKIIAPELYIAVGISGAIQHVAGVSGSKCIVALNKDPDAPIFEVADYGIVGDAFTVLPALVQAVKALHT